ncbi:F-box/kelch-repeat protein At3g23880-like [Apium graveolens]|uniref:F-box/kelch-repeat protein At3g23880-like n=1 Tax=Apium graveolens TaxID=4045 RepID=UPI003D79B569
MDLPAEIVADILSRLPIKTIVHCRTVCKRWHILLSEAYFVSLHLSRSPVGLIGHRTKLRSDLFNLGELDDNLEYHEFIDPCPLERLDLRSRLCWFLDSINGLIFYEVKVDHDYVLNICNPITREYIILPGDNCVRSSMYEIVTRGFGFVEASNQYKVVTLYLGSNKSECKIYTLGTGMWRSLGHLPFFVNGLQNGSVGGFGICSTFFAGNLYWLAKEEHTNKEMVYTFDLERESFQLTDSAPRVYGDLRNSRSLGTLGDYLCICDGIPDSDLVVIWTMKENWTKEFIIKSEYGLYFVRPLNLLKDR